MQDAPWTGLKCSAHSCTQGNKKKLWKTRNDGWEVWGMQQGNLANLRRFLTWCLTARNLQQPLANVSLGLCEWGLSFLHLPVFFPYFPTNHSLLHNLIMCNVNWKWRSFKEKPAFFKRGNFCFEGKPSPFLVCHTFHSFTAPERAGVCRQAHHYNSNYGHSNLLATKSITAKFLPGRWGIYIFP